MIELYEFNIGSTKSFFTSSAQDVLHGGDTYTAAPISRSSISSSATEFISSLEIYVDRHHPIALTAQKDSIEVIVSSMVGSTKETIWQGSIIGVMWNESGAVLSCEDSLAPVRKLTPAKRYTRNCRHVLYSDECGADLTYFRRFVDILESDPANRTVTFPVLSGLGDAPGYYDGGIIYEGKDRHQILTTSTYTEGGVIKVKAVLTQRVSLPIGATYSVAPGCNHTRNHCDEKFENIVNFGGFAYINFD